MLVSFFKTETFESLREVIVSFFRREGLLEEGGASAGHVSPYVFIGFSYLLNYLLKSSF